MNAEEYLKRGNNYLLKRNFDKAIEDFSETIKLEPDSPFAYHKRGVSYTNKKEFDLAITDFNTAIKIEPNKYGLYYCDRASAYILKGDKNSAISDIEMAIKIEPQNKDFRQFLDDIKANNNIGSVNTRSVETIKKEIKLILNRGIICGIIAAVPFAIYFSIFGGFNTVSEIIIGIIVGIIVGGWIGFGVGGNLSLLVYLFIKGQTLFGFLDFGWWDSRSTFGVNLIFLFFRLILGLSIAGYGFIAFAIAGPIWPLIRINIRKKQIKNIIK
ncbi:MAG: tetratricopeptide repeat protein [Treponema sp.]|nr:tetratricopeptide repeat protein [Treponema sp.]MCL2250327.1 tetratricopeptide repeat protein [Treponema sp.]